MIRVIQSNIGTYKFENAMLDINGTDLVDGVDVYLDDDHIGELIGHFDLEDCDGDILVEMGQILL